MLIWNCYDNSLINILSVLFMCIYISNPERCFCYLNSTTFQNHTNNKTNDKKLIQCSMIQSPLKYTEEISCQRVDKFVCVGPYPSYKNNNDDNNNYSSMNSHQYLSINPWAFSNLFINNLVDTLQLDIHMKINEINALSLAGMNGLRHLLARTSLITWDTCSFVELTSLREVTLNCKANFSNFLTFNSFISVIRFIDCENVPLQFYCIKCYQNSSINVIRIRSGPPLRQYLIKFTEFSSLINYNNHTNEYSLINKLNHLPLDSCITDICSDEMLCRDNLPVQQVHNRINQPEKPIIEIISYNNNNDNKEIVTTTSSSELFPLIKQFNNMTTIESVLQTNLSTTLQYINNTSFHNIMVLTKYGSSKTDHRQKIWIVSSILILILLFIITLGILIGINYQRKLKHKVKCSRSNKSLNNQHHHILSNGRTNQHDALIIIEDGNRIELPEIVS
ncbi:unnamed protein product [Heterobilharzia americana]|nr:unnamed protein product [Heterobilharzia americana]